MLAAERLKNEKRSRLSFNFLLQTQRQEQKATSQEEDTEGYQDSAHCMMYLKSVCVGQILVRRRTKFN